MLVAKSRPRHCLHVFAAENVHVVIEGAGWRHRRRQLGSSRDIPYGPRRPA